MKEFFKDKEFLRDLAIALVIAVVVVQFVRPTIVKGESMLPTLQNNNYLFLSMRACKHKLPEYGDIVVVESEALDEKIIKRVIGLPGDEIAVSDNVVYRNGKALQEDYIYEQGNIPGDVDVVVPDDSIFVMGDNRANSTDSRALGCISCDDIVGKVIFRLFPFNEMGTFENEEDMK